MSRSRIRLGPSGGFLLLCALLALLLCWQLSTTQAQSAPTPDSATADGATVTLTLSEALSAASSATASDFTLTLGTAAQPISAATASGSQISLTLGAPLPDGDCQADSVTLGYSGTTSVLENATGNALGDFSGLTVDNQTDAPPAVVSMETSETGRYIYIDFCEAVTSFGTQWSNFSAFTVNRNTSSVDVNDLRRESTRPTRIRLDLSSSKARWVKPGESVSVAYDRTSSNEDDPFADADQGGKLVQSWAARTVLNLVDGPPELVSVSAKYELIRLTFNEPLDETSVPDGSAFSLGGTSLLPDIDSVRIDGSTVILTLATILPSGSATYTLSYFEPNQTPLREADGSHHVADITSYAFSSGTPSKRPEVASANVTGRQLVLTFDLPLKAVATAAAFSVSGQAGVTVTASTFNGEIVTLTLSAEVDAASTITLSYSQPFEPPRIEGRNNKDANSFADQAVTNLTEAPAPTLTSGQVSADGGTLTLTFSLPLDDSTSGVPAASAFSLTGSNAALQSPAINGQQLTIRLDPLADAAEVISISYTPPADSTLARLKSKAHQEPVAAISAVSVTNSADGKPRPTTASVNGSMIVVQFDRPLDTTSVPPGAAFSIDGATTLVTSVALSAQRATLTLSTAVEHNQVISLSYTPPSTGSLKRAGLAALTGSFASFSVQNQTPDPTPKFTSASIDPAGRILTIVMSHPLSTLPSGTPDKSRFSLTGLTSDPIESVSVSGSTVSLTLSPAADFNDTVTLAYAPPSDATASALRSANGRWRSPAWTAASVLNHTDGVPRPLSAEVDGNVLMLHFDRSLSTAIIPAAATFSITPSIHSVSAVSIAGSTVTMQLDTAVAYGAAVTLSYAAPSQSPLTRSVHGLTVASFANVAVANNSPQKLLQSVIGNGAQITLSFREALDGDSIPATSAFAMAPSDLSISSVSVSGMTLLLTLSGSLTEGGVYTVTYTPPSESPLTTTGAQLLEAFTEPINNQTDVAPTVETVVGDGISLSIRFDQELDTSATVLPSAFALLANAAIAVTALGINDQAITLTSSRALKEDEAVTLTYTPPPSGGIADTSGLLSAAFTETVDNQTDTAPLPVSGTVEDDLIVIILDQALIKDPRFTEEPDGYPTEHFVLYGTDATITRVDVSHDGPGGDGKIDIRLGRAIREDETVSISYLPVTGNIRLYDDDGQNQRAEINSYNLRNLSDKPPVAEMATIDAQQISVIFDQSLDPTSVPAITAFNLVAAEPAEGEQKAHEPTLAGVTLSNATVTLTLDSSAQEDASYTLSYTQPVNGALSDTTGNLTADFSMSLDNVTDYAPTPVSVETNEDGTLVYISFDQGLEESVNLDAAWFTITPVHAIFEVRYDSSILPRRTLIIALDVGVFIEESAAISVSYTAPTSGGLSDDDANLPVASFTLPVKSQVDVAPKLLNAVVQSNIVTLTFDQTLDEEYVPPASCDWLRTQDEDLWLTVCGAIVALQPTWFRAQVVGGGFLEIVSVEVDQELVFLTLGEAVTASLDLLLEYQPRSEPAGQKWKLRDESGNDVEKIEAESVENITAAAALRAAIDRAQPERIIVEFDGGLDANSLPASDAVIVQINGNSSEVDAFTTQDRTLSVSLPAPVVECALVSIAYAASEPWLDAAEHPILSFQLPVRNLIDSDWGLRCVDSDFGGIILGFVSELGEDAKSPKRWRLWVNGAARDFRLGVADGVITLYAEPSICQGDEVEIHFLDSGGVAIAQLRRTIEEAAPCARSASAEGRMIEVAFDDQVVAASAPAADFELSGSSRVEAVESNEHNKLMLRLAAPGLLRERNPKLRYVGQTLSDGERSVGPFALDIEDHTAAPQLASAIGNYSSLTLQFDQPMLSRAIGASRFSLLGPGVEMKVRSVTIDGTAVRLELSDWLPDDPAVLGLVYDAGKSGGLAGLTGIRVPTGMFLVTNRTETAPGVLEMVASEQTVELTFNQPVNGRKASVDDFVVRAGHREIRTAELVWSRESVVLTLENRITSLDAVEVIYEPSDGRAVRDLTGFSLRGFQDWAANRTKRPKSIAQRIADAELRASSGQTSLLRELARGFAATSGIDVHLAPGDAETTVARGSLAIQVEIDERAEESIRLSASRLQYVDALMKRAGAVPTDCDGVDDGDVWWIGERDVFGRPTERRIDVALSQNSDAPAAEAFCVLDLVSEEWKVAEVSEAVQSPALVASIASMETISQAAPFER